MTNFCDHDNNIKKKRNRSIQKLYNPTNSLILFKLFCLFVLKVNKITVLCSLDF